MDVYFTGSGLRWDENLNVLQTILYKPTARLRSVHGVSSGSVFCILLLEALCHEDPHEYVHIMMKQFQQLAKRRAYLVYVIDSGLQYLWDHTSEDIHTKASGLLHIYYTKFNTKGGGTRVVESTWDTKKDLFRSIRRSSSIPFVTTWPMYDEEFFYYDGMGFIGDIYPHPDRVTLVSVCNVPRLLFNHLMYVPPLQYPKPITPLRRGTVLLSTGHYEYNRYRPPHTWCIRSFTNMVGILVRYRRVLRWLSIMLCFLVFRHLWNHWGKIGSEARRLFYIGREFFVQ